MGHYYAELCCPGCDKIGCNNCSCPREPSPWLCSCPRWKGFCEHQRNEIMEAFKENSKPNREENK